ncbi:hypothetical protein [Wolbachia endosymbiont of Cantharis cryptica]|uniref:hypothetical protein n=1 Tax=Wolbachia endosymbiont of Cantharis cryptica TaxID=3066132 RepID=UPI00376F05D3
MWKNIKKFFKWIADHTGISWILGKISSCWKPGDTVSQPGGTNPLESKASNFQSNSMIELLQNKPGVFDVIRKGDNRHLVLHVAINKTSEVFDNVNCQNPSEYHVCIKCDKGVFEVILGRVLCINAFYSSFNVHSITHCDRNTLYSELEDMRNVLGLSEGGSPVIVTQISKNPITVGNAPNSKTTNLKTQPHTAGVGQSV